MMNKKMEESQEMMNKKDIFYVITIIFVFILLIVFFGILSNVVNFHFTSNQLINLLGIIISCISIVITAYFVLLAIDAYGKIQEIDKAKAKADELIQTASSAKEIVSKAEEHAKTLSKEIHETKNEIEELANDTYRQVNANKQLLIDASHEIGEILISFNESAVVQAEQEKNRDLRESSLRRLFRLSYKYPDLIKESTRINYIRNLASFGDESDIKHLERIFNSDKETVEIKRITATVLEELRNKYNH